MKKGLILSIFLFIGICSISNASPITNGNFETGNLDGWAVSTISDGDVTVGMVDGDYAAKGVTSASISQSYSWVAGETVTFDWKWNYNDWGSPYNDNIYWGVTDTVGSNSYSQILSTYTDFNWTTNTYTFTNSGSGYIFFGVDDGVDESVNSFGYFDNISSTGGAPVPEPATMLLLGTGLAGLAGFRKKFRKS